MKFANNKIVSNSGSPVKEVFGPKVRPDGSIDVVPVGKENTDRIIQSFAQSTDMSFILSKLAQGDTSVLHQRSPMFGDFSKVPSTYAEVLQMRIDAGRCFDRLPVDVKRQFDNDVNKFLASAGSPSWLEKLDGVLPDEFKQLYKQPVDVQPIDKEKGVVE